MSVALSLVLASSSPRRLALLQQLGLQPLVRRPDTDESVRPGESADALVARLSNAKARAVDASPDEVVLAADTVVLLDGDILGKPRDQADGLAMLMRLSGREHEVLTGVSVKRGEHVSGVTVSTRVRLAEITAGQARAYWASGEPCDKAGGYAIQGRAARFVEALHGSYSNAVGLPLHESARLLEAAGIVLD